MRGGVFLIVLVYAHLAARIPITGFAYQWNSRLINPHYGWFTGYTALLAFMAGTAATAVALATVFASDVWTSPTHGDIVLFATLAMVAAAIINIISIRAVSAVNNTGVFFEITGSVGAAALLFFGAIFFFHHDAGFSILVSTQRTTGGSLWYGFVLAALLPLYCFIGWEGAADLAEETNDPRKVTPFAMIRANYVSVAASLFMIVGFLIAIPAGVGKLLGQPKNPLVYIFQSHFGAVAADILQVVVFLAIFSCVLANMVVATRLTFALSRDKMLPGSGVLGHVNATPARPSRRSCWSPRSASGSTCCRPGSPPTWCRSAASPTTSSTRSPSAAPSTRTRRRPCRPAMGTSRWAGGSCRSPGPPSCTPRPSS